MPASTETKRRSHLNRLAANRTVQITDNDIRDIFEPLARHRQLSTRQLVAFGARHPIATKLRLGSLWHATQNETAHWLHRVNENFPFANHLTVEDLHCLGDEAEAALVTAKIIPDEDWVAACRIGGKSLAPSKIMRLAHDHMASDIALDIEIGARKAGADYKSHIDIFRAGSNFARRQKKPLKIPLTLSGEKTFIEPDALFAIGNRVYALEADKGTESIKAVIVQKILAYREIVAAKVIDDYLGVDNLTVLFATSSRKRMEHVMKELAGIAHNSRSRMFGFRAEDTFDDFLHTPAPSGRLFSEPWARVGHDDLILST